MAFKVAKEKASELGKTPAGYIEFLIDTAAKTFNEILSPVRENFRASEVTEQELGDAVNDARIAIHQPN